jgi:hypothetical protein
MHTWLDALLVTLAVIASVLYAAYALGPKKLRNVYSRYATKYFGLRAAKWFVTKPAASSDCSNCGERDVHLSSKKTVTPTHQKPSH